jgi:tRNA 2-thiocytidine biosynthesis protein TtcA
MPDFELPLAIKIRKQIVTALADFDMLHAGDKLMVCCSGGKDSTILLALLTEIQRRAPFQFELEAVMLDQKQPGFDASAFKVWVQELGVKLTVLERDTYSIVKEKVTDGVYCSLCSRLRRAILYDYAADQGFTKMALGHHRDDVNQTLLMNLFYTGKLSSMPAKLKSDDGRNILLRPLIYVAEADLTQLQATWAFPVIPCNLCGSQTGMKRQMIKSLLNDLGKKIPEIQNSMLGAQSNVKPSQLLDPKLWNFKELAADAEPVPIDTGVDPFAGF